MSQSAPETKAWLYSESSTGRYLGSLRVSARSIRKMDYWEAIGVAREEFTIVIQPNLLSYLKENSSEISTSAHFLNISLYMIGKSMLKTKPTIVFVSDDKKVRKEALKLANQSGILLEYPGFALGACPLIAESAGLNQPGDHDDKHDSSSGGEINRVELFTHSTSLSAGTRLCAKSTGRPDRFATAGGLLIHNGATLGLTVGHILRSELTTDLNELDESDDECDFIGLDDSDDDNEDEEERRVKFVDSTSLGSGSPDALPNSYISDAASVSSFDMEDSERPFLNFLAEVGQETETRLDQSLVLSVNRGSEFTNKVGDIMFSSEALDYCVFRMQLDERSKQSWANTTIDLGSPETSLEYGPQATEISVLNNRIGVIRGFMKGFSTYCRFPSTSEFQEVFSARLNKPLVAGDCGSWVYNRPLYHVNLDFSTSVSVIGPEQRAALRELMTKPAERT